MDVSSEQEPTATDGHVCNSVQIFREWLSMRLLLVYSDWGEMDMGWGQGHVDLSFTAETVNSRNSQR